MVDRVEPGPAHRRVRGEGRRERVELRHDGRLRDHGGALPPGVPRQHDVSRQVEDDRDTRDAGLGRTGDERPPGVWLTLVASITVSRPDRSRATTARWRAPNAGFVAAWLAGSPLTSARNASEDRTSSGAKWRAANVDLPEPAAATSTTSEGSGRSMTRGTGEDGRAIRR